MAQRTDYLTMFAKDRPPRLVFAGCPDAGLFSRILKESLDGVLEKNYIKDHKDKMAGFVSASTDGRVWWDTMWTRDAGVFLRELTHLGYYNHACILTERLISMVQKNAKGFYTFPEYFKYGQPGSGNELDGTGAILIGMVLLWERLPDGNPYKDTIYQFIDSPES
ncbi:MAG: hypothetical protein SCM11_20995, partial [Bacillota bacterium]|nr:hypothetical protein [Bacillota bacterium]